MKTQRNEIDHQARYWYTRLGSGAVSENERAEFQAWQSLHPAHAQSYAYLSALDVIIGECAEEVAEGSVMEQTVTSGRKTMNTWGSWGAVAATLLIAVFVVFNTQMPPDVLILSTGIGEMREVPLADGSSMYLGGNTRVEVAYNDQQRNLTLLHGEAVFNVQHDPGRPFIVDAGGTKIRAVGTAFDVNRHPHDLVVSMLEGVVAITWLDPEAESGEGASKGETPEQEAPAQETKKPILIKKGQQITFKDGEVSGSITTDTPDHFATWRNGLLEFNQIELESVVADLNRHAKGQIILSDEAIGHLPVTAVFKLGDFERATDLLQEILPIRASRIGTDRIVLSPLRVDGGN